MIKALEPIIADYSGWHWLNKDPQNPRSTNAVNRLAEIRVPTLAVVGVGDLTYFHDIASTLAAGIPTAHKEIVSGAGHMVNMEAPDQVNQMLEAHFLLDR